MATKRKAASTTKSSSKGVKKMGKPYTKKAYPGVTFQAGSKNGVVGVFATGKDKNGKTKTLFTPGIKD